MNFLFSFGKMKKGMQNLESINSEWIKGKIKSHGIKNSDLATALNVSDSQISQWLSGTRNPSSATKAALHYYFQSMELKPAKKSK